VVQLGIVLAVFGLIFVAELPDKTMIATLIMGSRYRPVLVWLGAVLAFGIHVTIAVAVGQLLQLLPHRWIEGVTALLFAAGAAYLLFVPEKEEEDEGEE
jgi:putative Ca2+/H+ antiporter (TMEM165/GDT1 family)